MSGAGWLALYLAGGGALYALAFAQVCWADSGDPRRALLGWWAVFLAGFLLWPVLAVAAASAALAGWRAGR